MRMAFRIRYRQDGRRWQVRFAVVNATPPPCRRREQWVVYSTSQSRGPENKPRAVTALRHIAANVATRYPVRAE